MGLTGDALVSWLREDYRQAQRVVPGPLGPRPMVYADFTASGRVLPALERRMARNVAPYYANTHSETAYTGMQTTRLREAARAEMRAAVGAGTEHAVIFAGAGATAGIGKLVGALKPGPGAVIFLGPFEHHSNDLPWRECGALIERIPLDRYGQVCLGTLEESLGRHEGATLPLGAFSAASNVTGIKTDLRPIAKLMHAHAGWLFADFAAGAPYIPIAMGESAPGAGDGIDAIAFSPHKFLGGPGASGVLVADRRLFASAIPTQPGGGTVSYVTAGRHCYVADIERREEAGTPNVLGDIRAGLVMALKGAIGTDIIHRAEARAIDRAVARWGAIGEIQILGGTEAERLAIFALVIRCGESVLHPGLVVAVLNDFFGIQARAGCSCAGPYGHSLLGIDEAGAARYEARVAEGFPMFRPGWTRLGFHVLHDDAEINYIIDAVAFIARHAKALLGLYAPDLRTGRWTCRIGACAEATEFSALCAWGEVEGEEAIPVPPSHDVIFAAAEAAIAAGAGIPHSQSELPEALEVDRWFAVGAAAA